MKHFPQRLMTFFVLCVSTMVTVAQTDVTDKYLTNAGFDDSGCLQSSNVITAASANVMVVSGWEITESGGWTCGAALGLGSGAQLNGATLPSVGSDGKKSGVLGLSAGWGGSVEYSQKAILPVGLYRITIPVQNVNSDATQTYNRIGLVESNGMQHFGTTINFAKGNWVMEQIVFHNKTNQEVTFKIGMEAISGGSGANAKLIVDYVKIEAYNAADFTNTTKQGSFTNSSSSWGGSGTYAAKYQGTYYTGAEIFRWAASLDLGSRLQQTISNLPEGLYEVDLLAAASSTSSRDNTGNVISENSNKYNSVHANGASLPVVASNRIDFSEYGHYALRTIVGADGKLTASLNEDYPGPNWLVIYGRTYKKLVPTVELSFPLPTGEVRAGYWYSVNVPEDADYTLVQTGTANISYTQDATKSVTGSFSTTTGGKLSFKTGVLYLMADDVTEITIGGLETSYKLGDVDYDNLIKIDDADKLREILLGKEASSRRADVNRDGRVSISDQTTLIEILRGNKEPIIVSDAWRSASIKAMVYAEQLADENAASGEYMTNSAVSTIDGSDVASEVSIEPYLTTLMIDASALEGVESVSIYALDGTDIAGPATFTTSDEVLTSYSANQSTTSTPYATSILSNVVTVVGNTNGLYKAFLLPNKLSKGVKVTARCSDGRFYSKDFMVTTSSVNHLAFSSDIAPQNLWMSTLPGNTRFNLLSTPGSHDAATYTLYDDEVLQFIEIMKEAEETGDETIYDRLLELYGDRMMEILFKAMSVCQKESIEEQLANGVRAFDLRPTYTGDVSSIELNNLMIYHGMVNTNVLFKDAISTLVDFVKRNPSESVSVIMQKESSNGADQSPTWRTSIRTCFQQYADYMVQDINPNMTLDDCRGKIVVVTKNPYGSENVYWDVVNGGKVEGWPDAANSTTSYIYNEWGNRAVDVSVQDSYNAKVEEKKQYILEYANMSSSDNSTRWFYNFVSEANDLPLDGASKLNPYAAEKLKEMSGRLGYVFGDCMGSDVNSGHELLQTIVNQNYKYINKGRTRVVR